VSEEDKDSFCYMQKLQKYDKEPITKRYTYKLFLNLKNPKNKQPRSKHIKENNHFSPYCL